MTGNDEYPEMDEGLDDTVNGDSQPIVSETKDWTVSSLKTKFEKGQINLQPAYQRSYVWEKKPELPSRLIESLLLQIPIPPIYLGKLPTGKLEVIDGQQRLTTLVKYASNEFALVRLGRLKDLNGKWYKDLNEEHQIKIDDSTIRTIVIDTGSDPNLRYEIFERLNRGSVALNEQEIRNCIFHGPFCDLIARLENTASWRNVRGTYVPEDRFKEREMILRFFAFSAKIDQYRGNLKKFLNMYMGDMFNQEQFKPLNPAYSTQLVEKEAMFNQTMSNVYTVFGEHAARLYTVGSVEKWDSKFSISALDVQASALINRTPAKVQQAADQIKEAYILYLLTHPNVQEAISKQPASKQATETRWFGFKAEVTKILSNCILEPRFFSYEVRKQMFETSDVCALCHGQIHKLENATVDHITPYSKGGKTEPQNAQLAHRSCNAKKCANMPIAMASKDEDYDLDDLV